MRLLLTDFFARSPAMAGPVVAILLFAFVFGLVIAYLMAGKRERFDAMAAIPLDSETPPRRGHDE